VPSDAGSGSALSGATDPTGIASWASGRLNISFANIPHRRWIYGTYLIRGEITFVVAPGGVGKTSQVTGIATEIAVGKELLGEKIFGNDLKVLYLNGEDAGVEIARRICAFCLTHNIAEKELRRLFVAGKDDPRVHRLSFLEAREKTSVVDRNGLAALESALEILKPDVVILDPLVMFCGGADMNNNGLMAQMMRELKSLASRFDCAILIVHHTKKGGERGDAEAASGAAALVNLARCALMLVSMTKDEGNAYNIPPSLQWRYLRLINAKRTSRHARRTIVGIISAAKCSPTPSRRPFPKAMGYNQLLVSI
jgi:hypothetical protein